MIKVKITSKLIKKTIHETIANKIHRDLGDYPNFNNSPESDYYINLYLNNSRFWFSVETGRHAIRFLTRIS